MSTRRASHAGSWYSSQAKELNLQLEGWLAKASPTHRPAQAIIAPHAGYNYCGACAAHAYKQVDPSKVKRIFILGPSHHAYLSGCDVTGASVYQTPFYNLQVDAAVTRELLATGSFETMSRSVDEEEHSIEMHLPYIAKVMESHRHDFTIVPILVGALSVENEKYYGKLLSKYLSNPENLFVASSDFCHWGKRFRFTHHDKRCQSIHQSIHDLDHMGMEIIERLDAKGFTDYLKKYGNTICGRHPIAVMLYGLQHLSQCNGPSPNLSFKFLNYAQSSQVYDCDDSSVSYAAGALNMTF